MIHSGVQSQQELICLCNNIDGSKEEHNTFWDADKIAVLSLSSKLYKDYHFVILPTNICPFLFFTALRQSLTSQGAFTNYVYRICLFFDHLFPSVYIFYGIKVYKKSICLTTYTPALVNVVCERPLIKNEQVHARAEGESENLWMPVLFGGLNLHPFPWFIQG